MAGMIDLDTCVAAYYCDTAGVVADVLVDQTAYGNDLTLVTGTAVFETRDTFECLSLNNTFWFEGESALLPWGSIVVVAVVDGAAGDGALEAIITASPIDEDDDHEGLEILTDAEWLSSTYERRRVTFTDETPRISDRAGTAAVCTNFTIGAMNILTGAWTTETGELKGATDSQTPVEAAYTNNYNASRVGDRMRVGQLKTSGGLTALKYLALKRIFIFTGDVFTHADYATKLAEEKALWNI
jgi:hypothetical protein